MSHSVVITKEFVVSVVIATRALQDRASSLEGSPQFADNNAVGDTLRFTVERNRQHADMLAGWVRRHAEAVGLDPREFEI